MHAFHAQRQLVPREPGRGPRRAPFRRRGRARARRRFAVRRGRPRPRVRARLLLLLLCARGLLLGRRLPRVPDRGGRGNASQRAGVWRSGCFLAYADTSAASAHEDAFRGWFYDDDNVDEPTAALGSQCAADRTEAECSRCANESAQVVPALKVGRQLSMVHGDAVVVVGYACYLRVPLFSPMPRWQQKRELSCPPLYPLSHSIPASSLVVRGRRNQAPDE